VEYNLESILRALISICYFYYDEGLCAYEGEGEGLEVRWRLFSGIDRAGPAHHVDFQ
jgi:hypothetical protein